MRICSDDGKNAKLLTLQGLTQFCISECWMAGRTLVESGPIAVYLVCEARLSQNNGFLIQSTDPCFSAEVNLAWWLAWTSNPVGFAGR